MSVPRILGRKLLAKDIIVGHWVEASGFTVTVLCVSLTLRYESRTVGVNRN
jgi:hypothetical protein